MNLLALRLCVFFHLMPSILVLTLSRVVLLCPIAMLMISSPSDLKVFAFALTVHNL